jgi:D-arabinose 1-dehydrogenase-like Zn-dependent alcohol dehydrogenase
MKAVVYRRYSGPEVLELTELSEPKTHVDSVLIRVRAAGLNRTDAAIQAGALDSAVETYFPVVPGWDVAGVVERSGPGAPEFAVGDEVIAYVRGDVQRAHGGFAELVSSDVRGVVRKASALSFAEAAGLPLAALTAYQGVVHALAVRQGENLLVHGAAGGVGSVAVQINWLCPIGIWSSASPCPMRNAESLRTDDTHAARLVGDPPRPAPGGRRRCLTRRRSARTSGCRVRRGRRWSRTGSTARRTRGG